MAGKPLKLSDTTFRDAHQSLMATRLRTEDMIPLAEEMDSIGFFSMEVWGGATFDSATRFLAEDPWERLRTFKSLMPNTNLSMLLRGQSLVGYRNYADDVVDKFVERSAENGIDIFRVFDALNYEPNLERAANAVKNAGSHLQLAICYTIGEGEKMGGDIYNLEYFLSKARSFRDLGADSICIKDMGGLLAPYDAFELVTAIKSEIDLPLQLHAHYTSGMASMTALKAVEAGLDILDVCLAPLALRPSQPAVEPIAVTLMGTDRDPGVDLDALLDLGDKLEEILPKYADHLETPRSAVIDARVLSHQIPGGMASNMVSQLREADALDRMREVMEEIPRTRADLGFPPLVTPMSQMVGAQAVNNVIFGRYTVVSEPVKEYLRGNYGKPVSPVRSELIHKLAESEEISPAPERPGAVIEPELEAAREVVSDLTDDIDDALIYALYPQTGERFLRIKHGLEPVPDEMKPKTLEEVQQAARVSRQAAAPAPPMSGRARRFNIYVGDQFFEIDVDPVGAGAMPAPVAASAPASTAAQAAPTPDGQSEISEGETAVVSPMPGILISVAVEEGQAVAAGDPLLVLEAMKMQNTIPSPVDGTIKSLPVVAGTQVVKDQVLAVIQT
ncbi:MAG: pyruvate carboxylase subunit B [Dehalococcoidia bacterium]|nr:pyruvate carboxylase subunit B [Dehalococcoidia bacterium]